ncbi:MAG: PTS sugar transporter subunit IIB [Hydrogenibacillus schlegelii]|uniref:PTS sugar transporter subunit IIB n=1 Tax=Hydrogenibacillus schlegelii TaxID=1484 RepID=A0A947CU49_HYDSH|nr:PTS sugar transporter subunit IIB [Hydrogenibacillus schlegelii]MBT9281087.1 PTS sugar transporter subunit IIB [Hydrogenibacillus schlegelii]
MLRILVVCGHGLGSSFMLSMTARKACEELGIEAEIGHTDFSSAKSERADLYIATQDIADQLEDGTRTVIKVLNIMDRQFLKEAIRRHIEGG